MTLPKWNAATWFVAIMAAQQFVAAVVYACGKDFKHAAYWFFAGCIAVTTMFF